MKLSCTFPAEFRDFSFCQKISVLELNHISTEEINLPCISGFNGKHIVLTSFCLSPWSSELSFCNAESMKLEFCFGLFSLLHMPRSNTLTTVNLIELDGFYCQRMEDFSNLSCVPMVTVPMCVLIVV
jgi:hypothetical protein